jgi:hypothetical protein
MTEQRRSATNLILWGVGTPRTLRPHWALAELGLDKLRLGDVVAVQDTDSRYNHGYLRGAMSIGIVGQTDGPRAGYGPGMTIVLTAPSGQLGSYSAPGTNIATLLGLVK